MLNGGADVIDKAWPSCLRDWNISRADHIQPKTSVKIGGFEAKDCAFAV
jgi:hypothetical protein